LGLSPWPIVRPTAWVAHRGRCATRYGRPAYNGPGRLPVYSRSSHSHPAGRRFGLRLRSSHVGSPRPPGPVSCAYTAAPRTPRDPALVPAAPVRPLPAVRVTPACRPVAVPAPPPAGNRRNWFTRHGAGTPRPVYVSSAVSCLLTAEPCMLYLLVLTLTVCLRDS
jgi:hypothetical protein